MNATLRNDMTTLADGTYTATWTGYELTVDGRTEKFLTYNPAKGTQIVTLTVEDCQAFVA